MSLYILINHTHSFTDRICLKERDASMFYIFVLFIKRQEPDDGESECSLILS